MRVAIRVASWRAEITTTGMRLIVSLANCAVLNSSPLMIGIIRSRRMRQGRCSRARLNAFMPLVAVTTSYPSHPASGRASGGYLGHHRPPESVAPSCSCADVRSDGNSGETDVAPAPPLACPERTARRSLRCFCCPLRKFFCFLRSLRGGPRRRAREIRRMLAGPRLRRAGT